MVHGVVHALVRVQCLFQLTKINKQFKKKQMKRYQQNLRLDGHKIISYNTIIGMIEGNNLIQLGYFSKTSQKHINYVANEYKLTIIKNY